MTIDPQLRRRAVQHLRRGDLVLRAVIDDVGPFTLTLQRQRFAMLVYSIISQQVSTAAARSIRGRVQMLAGGRVTAERLSALTDEQLRGAGISPQKLRYMRDLIEKTRNKTIRLARHHHLSDQAVIDELVQVKGIGVWTAQMFLIFSLGRMDVLPTDDLGIRAAIRKLYGLVELPTRGECETIAAPWRPYATVASWYCWRSLEKK